MEGDELESRAPLSRKPRSRHSTILEASGLDLVVRCSPLHAQLTSALQIIDAADEVINSIDRDELAKYFAFKSDAEEGKASAKATTEGSQDVAASGDGDELVQRPGAHPIFLKRNLFEENSGELKKWIDVC